MGGRVWSEQLSSFVFEGLQLRPINVLIGANGSGKSNFLDLFAFLRSVRAAKLAGYVARSGGAGKILHFGRRTTPKLTIEVWFRLPRPEWFSGYRIDLEPTDSDGLAPAHESLYIWHRARFDDAFSTGSGPAKPQAGEAKISAEDEYSFPPIDGADYYAREARKLAREHLASWRCFQFHDTSSVSPIKKTCDLHDNRYLRENGANLAAYLHRLRQTHRESYNSIRQTIQLVAPFFEDFRIEPMALNTEKLQLEWSHRGSDDYFGASSLSDGTLRFMALATLLLQPVELRPRTILIDEPELGLHPYAIELLASMIRSASNDTQVILATQSPILLDYFEPEDVLVADRTGEETKLRRLETAPLKEWLEDYSLGQLWEKNELGGRPGDE